MENTTGAATGRCQITDRVLPLDELVEIEGYLVSAEGKAELLERLRTGQALPGQMTTATASQRFVGLFVDGIILFLLGAAVNLLLFGEFMLTNPADAFSGLGIFAQLLGYAFGIAYFTYFHGVRGQTLGKMAAKTKVVTLSGELIGTQKALVRVLVYYGPGLITPILFLLSDSIAALAGMIGGVWFLVNVIVMALDKSQLRTMHDRIAGSRVIQLD